MVAGEVKHAAAASRRLARVGLDEPTTGAADDHGLEARHAGAKAVAAAGARGCAVAWMLARPVHLQVGVHGRPAARAGTARHCLRLELGRPAARAGTAGHDLRRLWGRSTGFGARGRGDQRLTRL